MTDTSSRPVRTRFAPSPTGYLHLGGARTALFSWAFARHFGGTFVLRIEDTDLERSTPEAVQAILDGMRWLELTADEGPFYQMQRMDRYRAVIADMLAQGTAYHCYSTPEEVEAMRERARAAGAKPRYDGTWRPEPGKTLPPVPAGIRPVVRFRSPQDGVTAWDDLVNLPHQFRQQRARRSGDRPARRHPHLQLLCGGGRLGHAHHPCHPRRRPRQQYPAPDQHPARAGRRAAALWPRADDPGADGEKLSKRHGAVSVMEYDRMGYLPEAMVNYLARLGWSHGNDELFSREQFVEWFDPRHLSRSAAQWDPKKLNWVNAHALRALEPADLAERVAPRIVRRGGDPAAIDLPAVMALLRDRSETLEDLAEGALLFCGPYTPADDALRAEVLDEAARGLLGDFLQRAGALPDWTEEALDSLLKAILKDHGAKMPKLAIPLRVAVTGHKHTPSIGAVLALLGRETVLERLAASLA